jgi:hypothetical protein
MKTRTLFITRAVVLLLLTAGTARADLLSVGAGVWSDVGTGTETWDRGANPSGSQNITIPVLNGTGSPTATMFGWALGIEIVPVGGATGTLSIGATSDTIDPNTGSVINPPPNDVFTNSSGVLTPFVSSSPAYTTISNTNAASAGVKVPTSGDNLVYFNLTSTNAVGTFKIVAFNDSSNGYSNWTYDNLSNPSDPNNSLSFAFTNIGASGSFPGSEQQFVLGTITVLAPSAVPEPGSLVLAGVAAAGYAGYGWRRKRRLAGEALPNTADGHNSPA